MMSQTLHHVLEDFGSRAPEASEPVSRIAFLARPADARPDPIANAIDDAFDRGRQLGREQERIAAEEQMATLAANHDKALEDYKKVYCEALATRLAEELRSGIDAARASIAGKLAILLRELLTRAVAERGIAELAAEIAALVDSKRGVTARLTGPQALLDLMLPRVSELAPDLVVEPSADPEAELRISVGDCIVESKLARILAQLEALA